MGSVQRPVALHRDHPIRDNEVDRRCGADVENAAMDPLPVEKVLRPAILAPRHNAEHVLHAERDSGPMVCFDLGHGHDEVGRKHCPRQPQVIEPGVVRPCSHFDQFVAIQINESELLAT